LIRDKDVPKKISEHIPDFSDVVAKHLSYWGEENQNYNLVSQFFKFTVDLWNNPALEAADKHARLKHIFDFVEMAIAQGDKEASDLFCIEFVQPVTKEQPYATEFLRLMGPASVRCWEIAQDWVRKQNRFS